MDVKVGGQIPFITDGEVTECAGDQAGLLTVCSRSKEINKMKQFLASRSIVPPRSSQEIIKKTMRAIGVSKESEIYMHPEYKKFIGSKEADTILNDQFKPKGPANSTALLNNYNIDDTMRHWSIHGKQLFDKKFYHVPYQMIDFEREGTELAHLDIAKLIDEKYDSFGVVLNTDVSAGHGKHWFCIYGDLKHQGTKQDPIILEFFNSSGNKPMEEIYIFFEKQKANLLVNHKIYMEYIYSIAGTQLQQSKTECGMWSLLYIWSRLMNKPVDWLIKIGATDKEIIEDARRKFFRN